DEIKGRGGGERHSAILAIEEEGVRFRSYLDGSVHFMAPETSMEVQAALGSDLALVFDECTPFHVDREYTARSTERTHRWLRRCPDPRGRARHRPLRLRHADPAGPSRPRARAGPGEPLARRPHDRALAREPRAHPGRLPVPGLRGRLPPRLPALPPQGPRAHR